MSASRQRCRLTGQRDQNSFESLEQRVVLTAAHTAEVMLGLQSGDGIGQPAKLSDVNDTLSLREIHRITGVDVAQAEYGLTGAGQTVVVIDSGVAYDHLSLGAGLGPDYRVVGGWDFTEEQDADPYDDGPAGFHGTHVAGIVAGSDSEHTGVAPAVDIVALRVFNDQGRGKLSWLESSLEWVINNVDTYEHPITTVNLSIGTNWNDITLPEYASLEDEFAELETMGVFVSVAAGNRFEAEKNGLSYPAASPNVVPVASSTISDTVSDFSQRSARTLVAPGEDIVSTVPDYLFDFNGVADDFYAASGTSMAAPYLAGASILVREALQRFDSELAFGSGAVKTIHDVLFATADLIHDQKSGLDYHRVNVGAAVESILGSSHSDGRLQPVFEQDDGVLTIRGTDRADEIQVDQYGTVRVNDDLFRFSPDEITSIQITGNGGSDRLSIKSRFDESRVSFAPGEVSISDNSKRAGNLKLTAEGFARIDVVVFGESTTAEFRGHADVADELVIKSTHSWMESDGYVNYIRAADSIVAHADGTDDTVVLFDSPDDDSLIVYAATGNVTLRSAASSTQVMGYSQVVVRAIEGGNDQATLVGTPGDEVVRSKATFESLKNDSFFVYAQGFDRTQFVGAGGQDSAKVYDSVGNDRLMMDGTAQAIVRPDSLSSLSGFERVEVYASAGHDIVEFNGTESSERFTLKSTHAWMEVDDRVNYARGFDRVRVHGGGGTDSAKLYDSAADDRFVLGPNAGSVVSPSFQLVVRAVSWIHAFSSDGDDTLEFQDRASIDELFASPQGIWLKGENYTTIAEGFSRFTSPGTEQSVLNLVLDDLLDTEI